MSEVNMNKMANNIKNRLYSRFHVGRATLGNADKVGFSAGWAHGDGDVKLLFGVDLSIIEPTRTTFRLGGRFELTKSIHVEATGQAGVEGKDHPDSIAFCGGIALSASLKETLGVEVVKWNPGIPDRDETIISAYLDPFKLVNLLFR